MEYAEPLTDKIIDKVNNEIRPDICVNLGDMIQASKNKEKDLANLEYIWKKLQGFNYYINIKIFFLFFVDINIGLKLLEKMEFLTIC